MKFPTRARREVNATALVETRNEVMVRSLLSGELWNGVEPYRPIVDGVEITDQPLQLFKRGEWQKEKPIVVGSNEAEMVYVSAVIGRISMPKKLFEVGTRVRENQQQKK